MSATAEADPFVKSGRVIMDDIPTLYVYDHCPFCVRVRLALGLKNIKYNVNFLANDDIPTPTKLVGKKIAPIFVSSSSCAGPSDLDLLDRHMFSLLRCLLSLGFTSRQSGHG